MKEICNNRNSNDKNDRIHWLSSFNMLENPETQVHKNANRIPKAVINTISNIFFNSPFPIKTGP